MLTPHRPHTSGLTICFVREAAVYRTRNRNASANCQRGGFSPRAIRGPPKGDKVRKAFVFPGQGSQKPGMGKALAEEYAASREVFEEVDEALGESLSRLIWEGDSEELTLTRNAQPALMATSMAAVAALESEGVQVESASCVAGHSLGEYSALCAARSISLADTARLLRIRGEAMQSAAPVGEGAMAALLGMGFEQASEVVADAGQGQICEVANDNEAGQVVISGHREAVERASALARERGAKRAIPLPVSAPFHCSLMEPAAKAVSEALAEVEISRPAVILIANVTAGATNDPEEIRSLLAKQVTGVVRWRESVEFISDGEIQETWELGAGKVLSGMIRRISGDMTCRSAGTPEEIRALAGH